MDALNSTHIAQWLDDEDMPPAAAGPVAHRSSQVSGEPEYIREICGRFASEKTEEEQKSCVIRGYN